MNCYKLIQTDKIIAIDSFNDYGTIIYTSVFDAYKRKFSLEKKFRMPSYLVVNGDCEKFNLNLTEILSGENISLFEVGKIKPGLLVKEIIPDQRIIDETGIGLNFNNYSMDELDKISMVLKEMSENSVKAINDLNKTYYEKGEQIISRFRKI